MAEEPKIMGLSFVASEGGGRRRKKRNPLIRLGGSPEPIPRKFASRPGARFWLPDD